MQQQMQQMQQTINTQEAARQAAADLAAQQVEQQGAPIGERNLPRKFPTTRSAINPPPCTRQDYEIKLALISLVQKKTFNGLAAEIPLDHTENFERVCNFSRANGVPPDYIKCTLFPFSLEGKAARWLDSLPTGTLTTWEQVRVAFLSHFYTKSKTAALRHKILNFKQKTDEPFYDAWERYKEYRRECPHHGFEDDYILEMFYDGVSYEFRNALDSSSNGDFMTQTTLGAFALIKNMASSSLNKNKEHDRSKSVNSTDDLAAKVDQLLKCNQSQVFIMEESASENNVSDTTTEGDNTVDDQQEVSYVNGQGWQYKNYHPNPNFRNNPHLFSYSKADNPVDNAQNSQGQNSGYQKPYQGRTYVLSQAQHNQFQNQKQQTAQPTTPLPTTALQDEIKGLATMMQQLLQGQQIQGKAMNQVTTDINSRMNHMFNDLSTKYDNVASHMRQMDVQIAQTAESVKSTKEWKKPTVRASRGSKVLYLERPTRILRSGRNLPDTISKKFSAAEKGKQKEGEQPRSEAIPLSDEEPEQSAETDLTPVAPPVEPVPPREYTPKVPYPVPAKTSRKDREETKCKKMLEDLTIKLPLVDAIQMIPSMRSLMKGSISGKVTGDSELLMVPSKFVLSIQIRRTVFACSLSDLGSSVNLVPYSVAKRLGFTNFKPTRLSLVFTDRSVKSPVGILEDLHVRVGNTFVPTDFVVLEFEEEPRDPLILGCPFLCTAGAIIDVWQGRIDLHLGDIAM
ncbi:PREDICTED: uncharacterized protein LOC106297653 [Brassica oleracea var. oleracea]|uniref:uncharacterized protein LOC106297653 n=1 Tax=Brassica oleracea var. oleracea TaxID=109376 RepID=UPI0006A6D6F7|nr:PREDICTED: uncharacterized protein LOC106297653 [Brassica oleracea var. oleracea]